jgi:hypothetical protein
MKNLLSRYKQHADSAKRAYFFHQVQVLHYIPGRVRLYSRHLVHNPELADAVSDYLQAIPEIRSFTVNPATGSVLIQYSPEDISGNPFLREVDEFVRKQYRR